MPRCDARTKRLPVALAARSPGRSRGSRSWTKRALGGLEIRPPRLVVGPPRAVLPHLQCNETVYWGGFGKGTSTHSFTSLRLAGQCPQLRHFPDLPVLPADHGTPITPELKPASLDLQPRTLNEKTGYFI